MAIYSGQRIEAELLDTVENPPLAILQQTVVQSVANGTWAVITFDSEIKDTRDGHSTTSNTSRYVCKLAGTYRVTGRVAFATNSTGSRGSRIHLNGNYIQGAANLAGAGTLAGISEASHMLDLAVGDYVEVAGGQNSGGSLSTAYVGESASMMYVEWIHS